MTVHSFVRHEKMECQRANAFQSGNLNRALSWQQKCRVPDILSGYMHRLPAHIDFDKKGKKDEDIHQILWDNII